MPSPDVDVYVSVEGFKLYHDARGNDITDYTDEAIEAALVRGSQFIDAQYGAKFPGQKTGGRSQTLAWPRELYDGSYVRDQEGFEIMPDEIPVEIQDATCEAALREAASPNSMMPDLERGGAITHMAAGSVEIDYAANAPSQTTFSIIDGILAGLLGNVRSGGISFARVMRA